MAQQMNGTTYRIMNPHCWKLLLEGWEVSPGGGRGSPHQYSLLENPTDRGAWWAAVYGVTQGQTRLKRLSSSSTLSKISDFYKYI